MQCPFFGGDGEAVAGKREMVEADLMIASDHERAGDGFRLARAARQGPGKAGLVDLALMGLERGDMGIAKDGEPVGLEPQRLLDGVEAGLHRLERQSIDQVKVDLRESRAPSACRTAAAVVSKLWTRLIAACTLRVEALHAKAGAVHSGASECRCEFAA